jgi:hypothetical protein
MSRDHYQGAPKKRAALINADGDIEALSAVKTDPKIIVGTATLSGTVTVNNSLFEAGSTAFISTQHPYPITEGINWFVGDGYLTVSGSVADYHTIGYQVYLP